MTKTTQKMLSNGMRIQAIHTPHTNVITTLILAKAGSRYESKENSGISHFLEHMFFKGSQKYKTPKEVSMAVDSFGGSFNAFTGKEYTGYYIKSAKENFNKASDILADMILNATLPAEEIEKERGVILQEMAMYQDAPMYQISWDFEKLMFGDQPLGRDQIGTKQLISNVTKEQLQTYREKLYTPKNLLVVLSGAVDESHIKRVENLFKDHTGPTPPTAAPYIPNLSQETIHLRTKKTEQYHISLGCESPAETAKDYIPSLLLSTILGGNMSSRMFQSLREDKGLCYSIHTRVDEYSDTSLLTTQAGVKQDKVLEAIQAIKDQYIKIGKEGVTDDELTRAKNYMIGKLSLETEDSEELAHQFGHSYLLYNTIEDFETKKDKINKITTEQINTLAQELFQPQNFKIAGIGPELNPEKIAQIIHS